MSVHQGKAKSLFLNAVEMPSVSERQAYLVAECGGDEALRREVETLLAHHAGMGSFLESAAPGPAVATSEEPVSEGPGTVIGPYKLMEQIGEGGMGLVFVAEQQQPVRRKVALKLIKPGMDTREVIARFEAERQALALMDHPNIAKVLDAGATDAGRPYFVMELVRGVPITEFGDANRLTPRQRLELFVSVCQAVQHAHTKGIIHRDLKPSNMLVTLHDGTPVVKVIDFGIAKAVGQQLTEKTIYSRFAQMVGTPLYMSPEQAEMSGLDLDTRTDIYALGVLLYELLTGTTPFDGERLRAVGYDELRRIIREEEPARPSARVSTLGQAAPTVSANRQSDPKRLGQLFRGELDWIVMKALEKDRNRRYETASAFATDVQRYLRDEAVEACPPSAWYRLRKFARRHKQGLLTASVVAAAVLLAATVSTALVWRANQGLHQALDRERDALKREQQNAYYERIALAEREWSANNLSRMLQLLEECPEDLRGWEWHYLRRLRYKTLAPLRHDAAVLYAVVSPDGRRIASSDQDGWVKLWDAQTGRELRKFRAHRDHARNVAFSPDGRRLATASWDGTVKVWDTQALNKDPDAPPLLALKGYGDVVRHVTFSPDGQRLAAACGRWMNAGQVQVWDAATGAQLLAVPAYVSTMKCLHFSPDGRRLVAVGQDPASEVKVWDAQTGRELLTLRGHTRPVGSVAYSPDGRHIASATEKGDSAEPVLLIWDALTGQELHRLRGRTNGVQCVAFSPDGRRLASAAKDHAVKLWDVPTGREVLTLRGHSGTVCGVAFSPDGHQLVSASLDRSVRVWDATPSEGTPDPGCLTLRGHSGDVNAVAFHPKDRRLVASAGTDGTVRLWDAGSGEQIRTLRGHSRSVHGLAFSPDGQRLAAAGGGVQKSAKTVTVWDTATWQEVPPSPLVTTQGLRTVAFSPDGRLLAAASTGSSPPVVVWDLATGAQIGVLHGHTWVIGQVAFSPDGRHLASASSDGTVRVWDVTTHKEVVSPPRRHGAGATGVAFSPDGQRLATAGLDGMVRVWDTTSWKPLLIRSEATGGVWCVAFSPDGRRLAWGSTDATVKVADATTGEVLQTLRGHTGWVQSVAFSPDGRRIASASSDGTVKIWDVPAVAEAAPEPDE
jgi:WD40 repeat protein/serine/threonine protein kinase